MGAARHTGQGKAAEEDLRADLRFCGRGEGPDMSPFSPELFVGQQRARPPFTARPPPHPIAAAAPPPGATALHAGWAGAELGSLSRPTQPEPRAGIRLEPGEETAARRQGVRARAWPRGSRAGTGSSADRGLLLAQLRPSLLAHLMLTSGVGSLLCLRGR